MNNTVFFGNGFNRLSPNTKSWDDLLKGISPKGIIKDIPNTLQYEDLYLGDKVDLSDLTSGSTNTKEYKVKQKIAQSIRDLSSNEAYAMLASLNVTSYITTNYDKTFENELLLNGFTSNNANSDISEKIYSIRRKHAYSNPDANSITTIWPIHGEMFYPQSIMLGYDHYCGAIGKIDSYLKGHYEYKRNDKVVKVGSIIDRIKDNNMQIHSWIDVFFMHNLHIIGFGMDYSEQDIWWLLVKRKRYIEEGKIGIKNKIHCYGSIENTKILLLESLGVDVHSSEPVNDGPKSWLELYIQMLTCLQKNL